MREAFEHFCDANYTVLAAGLSTVLAFFDTTTIRVAKVYIVCTLFRLNFRAAMMQSTAVAVRTDLILLDASMLGTSAVIEVAACSVLLDTTACSLA